MKQSSKCILNVGYYRTGSATLAKAAELVGFKVHDCSSQLQDIDAASLKLLLVDPLKAVTQWWTQEGGSDEMERLVMENDLVYGGYVPWLVMLLDGSFESFCNKMKGKHGKSIHLVATRRHLASFLTSELHQWVLHDMERKAGMTSEEERANLQELLASRALVHAAAMETMTMTFDSLPLEEIDQWPKLLDKHSVTKSMNGGASKSWDEAFQQAGKQNESSRLPLEGVLIALKIGSDLAAVAKQVDELLVGLKQDRLCNIVVVLGLDADEVKSRSTDQLVEHVGRIAPVHVVSLPNDGSQRSSAQTFRAWESMATVAFDKGADWVMPLDVQCKIECPYHYRSFYRAFLDISERLQCPLGLGCAWWNDSKASEDGRRVIPVIGRAHYEVFSGLVAANRSASCGKHDLMSFLETMYSRYDAAPLVKGARLSIAEDKNDAASMYDYGASAGSAEGWRDWVSDGNELIRKYLSTHTDSGCMHLDVVVPSYRLDMEYLERMSRLKVPEDMQTSFIFVVDNPKKLKQMYKAVDTESAALAMQKHLADLSGNDVRVLYNAVNSGAPAARNKGLDASSADFVLLLDDDVIPDEDLLFEYRTALRKCDDAVIGLVGMVHFPRRPDLFVEHAAVVICPLTGMFEIASNKLYEYPAWGITANLLVKRATTRFDTAYTAGEDVDFCLCLAKETGGKFLTAPRAKVMHDYWPGGFFAIIHHFFKWALGDGVLFSRHPYNCFKSWPNYVEFTAIFLSLLLPLIFKGMFSPYSLLFLLLGMFVVDVGVDMGDKLEREQRRTLIEHNFPWWYYIVAQSISNMYMDGFEIGRLVGNFRRGDLLRNLCSRYEWQCGRLPNHRVNVVRRDGTKFAGFVFVAAQYLYWFRK